LIQGRDLARPLCDVGSDRQWRRTRSCSRTTLKQPATGSVHNQSSSAPEERNALRCGVYLDNPIEKSIAEDELRGGDESVMPNAAKFDLTEAPGPDCFSGLLENPLRQSHEVRSHRQCEQEHVAQCFQKRPAASHRLLFYQFCR
jgi:hypothetical protein